MNDLPEGIKSTLQLFADDSKLYKVIKSKKDSEDLRQDFYSLMNWSTKWQLPFNIDKCIVMQIDSELGNKQTTTFVFKNKEFNLK